MLNLNMEPFPQLETPRLWLRRLTPADANEVFALRSNAQVMQYIPRPLAQTTEDALAHIDMITTSNQNGDSINWGIQLKDDPTLVGIMGFVRVEKEDFRAEVGYLLHPRLHGQGIMSEALEAVVNFGFDVLKFHTICAITDPANIPSQRVLEKNGFEKEGYFKQNCYHNGEFLDSVYFARLSPHPHTAP